MQQFNKIRWACIIIVRNCQRQHLEEYHTISPKSIDRFRTIHTKKLYCCNNQTKQKNLYLSHTQSPSDGIDIVLFFLCSFFSFRHLWKQRNLGASRGFAFVEFNTEEEATRWMEYKQVPLCHRLYTQLLAFATKYTKSQLNEICRPMRFECSN